jgi:integrase
LKRLWYSTARDIDVFVGQRKKSGMKNTTILKDLGYLARMLSFYDNDAVARFKAKYPAHVPKKYQKRAPSMEEGIVQKILDRAEEISVGNWTLMEAYGLVSLAICTGFRPKELRMLDVFNVHVSGDYAEILAVHVKGEGTYSNERWETVHPDGVGILKKYLEARRIKLASRDKNEVALSPPMMRKGGYLSYKKIRCLKSFVEEDIGVQFELRKDRPN